jgi:DnaJ-domain-containing protein 1
MAPAAWLLIGLVVSFWVVGLFSWRKRGQRKLFAEETGSRLDPEMESWIRTAREATSKINTQTKTDPSAEPKAPPLALPGLVLEGKPHEVLGVAENASADEINRAFKKLLHRYHPDRYTQEGSPEWFEAQKITIILTEARDYMIRALKKNP